MRNLAISLLGSASLLFLSSCARNNTVGQVPSAPVYTNSPQPGFIPAGTTVAVRTDQTIDATSANAGQIYPGSVTREIIGNNGAVLIPAGSPVELTVLGLNKGGVVGSNQIQLGLRSITVNGRRYMIGSPAVSQSGNRGLGANTRTAEMVGGGAAIGTLLGAVLGGGTGAAVGAVVGAAGGAAAQVITKGSQVKVPAETVLTFRTDEPLQLMGYQAGRPGHPTRLQRRTH